MKSRVLFLYSGGTIGQISEIRKGVSILVPPSDANIFKSACADVLNKFADRLDILFEIITTKDSTNMTPNDWEKLALRVRKAQEDEKYDAVAIAHGTDTLAYTATALALALHGKSPPQSGLNIPICITGAQTPIYLEGGDGRFNLENLFRTVEAAISEGVADVIVNFWNRILLGCRALKVSERSFDAFHSPAFPNVGEIDSSGVHLNLKYLRKKESAFNSSNFAPKFGRNVLSMELAPGIESGIILRLVGSGGVAAIIFKSLGEGNVCNDGEFNLLPAIKQITAEYLTPVFLTTKFAGGSATSLHYETGYEAVKNGAIPCYNHTDVAVDVKVRWLIGNGLCANLDQFRKAMNTSYAGEVSTAAPFQ